MTCKRVFAVSVVVVMVLVSGCGGAGVDGNTTREENVTGEGNESESAVQRDSIRRPDIHRHVFREDGVVCYSYRENLDTNNDVVGGTGGLSCLPLSETNVTSGDEPLHSGE